MSKIEQGRVYQQTDTVPLGWAFPETMVLLWANRRLGVALCTAISRTGEPDGDAFAMDLALIMKNYVLVKKAKAAKLLAKFYGDVPPGPVKTVEMFDDESGTRGSSCYCPGGD